MKISPIDKAIWIAGGVTLLVAIGLIAIGTAQGGPHALPHAGLSVTRADGTSIAFSVEVATTEAQKARGLMFRRAMPRDAGMLFIFTPDQPVSFWMKNTYIPLDMLFVRGDRSIAKIVTHTPPFSLAPIPSGEPVWGVIEINAGEADDRGIHVGDKVVYNAAPVP